MFSKIVPSRVTELSKDNFRLAVEIRLHHLLQPLHVREIGVHAKNIGQTILQSNFRKHRTNFHAVELSCQIDIGSRSVLPADHRAM